MDNLIEDEDQKKNVESIDGIEISTLSNISISPNKNYTKNYIMKLTKRTTSPNSVDLKNQNDKVYLQGDVNQYYSLDFKFTGLAVMICNFEFTNPSNNFPLELFKKDIESFQTLKKFNFDTYYYTNQNSMEIDQLIAKYTSFDYSDYACLFLCVSSHGSKYSFISSDELSIEINEEIIEPFYDVESLRNKPKIFLFDCCRIGSISSRISNKKQNRKKNKFADFSNYFLAYSTIINFVSKLSTEKGSFFISVFFEVLDNFGKTDDWDELERKMIKLMKDRHDQIPVFERRSEHKFAFAKLETNNKQQKILLIGKHVKIKNKNIP